MNEAPLTKRRKSAPASSLSRCGDRSWTRPSIALLALLALLAWASRLQAFPIGDLDILPRLELQGLYDDNVFRRPPGNPEEPVLGDGAIRIRPAISFAYEKPQLDGSLDYHTEFLYYSKLKTENTEAQNHRLAVAGNYRPNQRTRISLMDGLDVGQDIVELSELGLVDPANLSVLPANRGYIRNRAGIDLMRILARRTSLTGSAGYSFNQYDAFTDPSGETEPERQDQLASASLTASYQWHPRNSVTAGFTFFYNDYGTEGNGTIYLASLGDVWSLAPSLTLTGSGGFQVVEEVTAGVPGTQDAISPYGHLGATFSQADLTLSLALSYELRDSSGFAGTVNSASISGSARYQLWEHLSVAAFGFWSRDDPVESGGQAPGPTPAFATTESIQAGCHFEYSVLSWLSLNLDYTFVDQNTLDVLGADFQTNRVLGGFVLAAPARGGT